MGDPIAPEGEFQPNPEQGDKITERKSDIRRLVTDYFNLTTSVNDRKDMFRKFDEISGDLYSDKPLEEIDKDLYETDEIDEFREAVHIARFYWDNRENPHARLVPNSVSLLKSDKELDDFIEDPMGKTLVVIDDKADFWNKKREYDFQTLPDSPDTPDVFIKELNRPPEKHEATIKRQSPGENKVTIRGANNMIINTGHSNADGKLSDIDLGCYGEMAIMPGVELSGGSIGNGKDTFISLSVPYGDITQYSRTILSVQNIICQQYSLMEKGMLISPVYHGDDAEYGTTRIHNFGPFVVNKGGEVRGRNLIRDDIYKMDPGELIRVTHELRESLYLSTADIEELIEKGKETARNSGYLEEEGRDVSNEKTTEEINGDYKIITEKENGTDIDDGPDDISTRVNREKAKQVAINVDAAVDEGESQEVKREVINISREEVEEQFEIIGGAFQVSDIEGKGGIHVRTYNFPIYSEDKIGKYAHFKGLAEAVGWTVRSSEPVKNKIVIVLVKEPDQSDS